MNMIDVIRRRMMMGGRKVSYDAEIEYLESTGVQFIDTGIIPDADTGVYAHLEATSNADRYAIGLRDTTGNTRWCIGYNSIWYHGYGAYRNGLTRSAETEAQLNWLNDGLFVTHGSDRDNTQALTSLSFTPVNNIRIFGSAGVTGSAYVWEGRIYAFKVSQGSNIVMDLIPVRVGQTGYMYDKVSGRLLGNDGTGDFILGNDKL